MTNSKTKGAQRARGTSVLLFVLAAIATAVAIDLAGALALHWANGHLAPKTALWLSAALAVAIFLVLPVLVDLRITRAYRSLDAHAGTTILGTLSCFNVVLPAAFLLLAPAMSKNVLGEHGTWPAKLVGNEGGRGEAALARAVSWLTGQLPGPARTAAPEVASTNAPAATSSAPVAKSAPSTSESIPQRVFRERADSVAVITTRERLGDDLGAMLAQSMGMKTAYGFGSGFVVAEDGQLVTNYHVVEGAESIEVRLHDGRTFANVEIVNVDKAHDLAHLRIDARTQAVAPLAADEVIAVGISGIAIGSPLGLEYSVTSGIVSAVRDMQDTSFLQMDTTIAPGSSGGPLFDAGGRIVGVNTAGTAAGLNLAVHVKHVRALLVRPPNPRKLATFVARARIKETVVEGAEMTPVDRMTLQETLGLLAAVAESCIEAPAADARLVVEFTSGEGRASIDSNLPSKERACMGKSIDLMSMAVGLALGQAFAEEAAAGKTVTVRAPITGLGNSPDRTLDLRFVLKPAA